MADEFEARTSGYWVRNAPHYKTVFRILFGVIWLVDGVLKFLPGFVDQFPGMVSDAAAGQPSWMGWWFNFWIGQANANAAFWVYSTGALELALGIALVTGLLRKIAYAGGIALSLLIWTVPEGFGGTYSAGTTDPGVGVVYAILFLALIVINATYGSSRWSLDYLIERRFPRWAILAELKRGAPGGSPGAGAARPKAGLEA